MTNPASAQVVSAVGPIPQIVDPAAYRGVLGRTMRSTALEPPCARGPQAWLGRR
jgi:hypothetical protein